jgi:spore germination protein GerM
MQSFNYNFPMANRDNKNKTGIGLAVWVVASLILLIVFLVYRPKILTVLKNTDFFNKVFGKEPAFITNFQPKEIEAPEAESEITEEIILENIVSTRKNNLQVEEEITTPAITIRPKEKAIEEKEETQPKVPEKQESTKVEDLKSTPPETALIAKMEQHLYFIEISGEGSVLRKEVIRQIPKTNTPLTAAINALLSGPNISEVSKGYMSLIPEGTKLLSASVNNGVATINFSEEFLFNKYGVEGIYGQLMQVVYTATAFSNIDSVQFLIEGEKIESIQNVNMNEPFARNELLIEGMYNSENKETEGEEDDEF